MPGGVIGQASLAKPRQIAVRKKCKANDVDRRRGQTTPPAIRACQSLQNAIRDPTNRFVEQIAALIVIMAFAQVRHRRRNRRGGRRFHRIRRRNVRQNDPRTDFACIVHIIELIEIVLTPRRQQVSEIHFVEHGSEAQRQHVDLPMNGFEQLRMFHGLPCRAAPVGQCDGQFAFDKPPHADGIDGRHIHAAADAQWI